MRRSDASIEAVTFTLDAFAMTGDVEEAVHPFDRVAVKHPDARRHAQRQRTRSARRKRR